MRRQHTGLCLSRNGSARALSRGELRELEEEARDEDRGQSDPTEPR